MIKLERLNQELLAAGLSNIISLAQNWGGPQDEPNTTYHIRDNKIIRVTWSIAPAATQKQLAADIIAAHDGSPNVQERMLALDYEGGHLAAIGDFLSQLIVQGVLPRPRDWASAELLDCRAKIATARGPEPPDPLPVVGSLEARRNDFKALLATAPPLTNSQIIEGFKILFGVTP